MCAYIKNPFPRIYVYTSTNGLAFDEARARDLVHSGIDEKTKSQQDVPFINWRYILFKWNDSDEEMNLARQCAVEIGVGRLTWEITDHPENVFSRRFVPGSADLVQIEHEVWDTSNLGNAIPGSTPRARIEIPAATALNPLAAPAGTRLKIDTRVSNLSSRPYPAQASYGRRFVRLGAQLCGPDGTVAERDHARAWLPQTLRPATTTEIPIEVPIPDKRGHYAVKFDLVYEGIDWFEKCGSQTVTKPLVVW